MFQQVLARVQVLCLQFVRPCALFQHQLYNLELPAVAESCQELELLEQHLGLTLSVTNGEFFLFIFGFRYFLNEVSTDF